MVTDPSCGSLGSVGWWSGRSWHRWCSWWDGWGCRWGGSPDLPHALGPECSLGHRSAAYSEQPEREVRKHEKPSVTDQVKDLESSGTARNSVKLFSNVELRMFCFREPQTHYTLTPSEFCTMTTSCFYITMFSPDLHKGHFIYLHEHLITSRKITHCSFSH